MLLSKVSDAEIGMLLVESETVMTPLDRAHCVGGVPADGAAVRVGVPDAVERHSLATQLDRVSRILDRAVGRAHLDRGYRGAMASTARGPT